MAQTKLEVLWEVVQSTVIPFVMGRFMGGAHKSPPSTTGDSGQSEAPLKQQTTSILKPRNDEAIQLAVDAALRQLPDGETYIRNIQAVRDDLESHQQTDWRKNLGTHELTERFAVMITTKTITRGGNRGQTNQAGANQPQGGQERTEYKRERFPVDYELTADDPRVQHLVLVSKIVSADAVAGVARAKAYLLSAGLIAKQSPAEKAAAAAKKGEEMAAGAIYALVGTAENNDEVRRLEAALKAAPDDAVRERLQILIARETTAAKNREHAAKLSLRFGIGAIVVILITASIFWP